MNSTRSPEYAQYLIRHQQSWKGRLFQIPYQTHLHLLQLGRTLDVGCGAGRNLQTLTRESIGIDHNQLMIESCKSRGMNAFTTDEWRSVQEKEKASFDSILFSHVAEHMSSGQFLDLLQSMLPLLKMGGRVVIICPQEAGYRTDDTHIEFMDFQKIQSVFNQLGLTTEKQYSFPFFRTIGKIFPYNEFVSVGRKMT